MKYVRIKANISSGMGVFFLYRTNQIRIKKGHRLYSYFDQMNIKAKNLFNTTNFYIRQIATGTKKDAGVITAFEKNAIDTINNAIPEINNLKLKYVGKRRKSELLKPESNRKIIDDAKLYSTIDCYNQYLTYELLEGVFKVTDNPDYRCLPAHTNQWVMKQVFSNWKSYYKSLADYIKDPGKYKGKPHIPGYASKNGRKTIMFTNQTCVIKEGKFLCFPKTKDKLNIGKLGITKGELKQIRAIPYNDYVVLEIVFKVADKDPEYKTDKPDRVLGIDLGVDNFAAISNNVGARPLLVKGKVIKSQNYYYNRKRAYYYGLITRGKEPERRAKTSHRLERLDTKRFDKIKDFMHKVSFNIIQYAQKLNIDTIVVGKNIHWKQNIELRKDVKLTFASIPYTLFINMLIYKARAKGIKVILQEESYTSLASFLDNDPIPVYGDKQKYTFSGRRIKRGAYESAGGNIINADVNASYNILKKAVPEAFKQWPGDKGVVSIPLVLSMACPSGRVET